MEKAINVSSSSAFGGESWSPRTDTHRQEIGRLWLKCGIDTEWAPLKAVLLHRPGKELEEISDPDAANMIAAPDAELARRQHDAMAEAYRKEGVAVHYVQPDIPTPPPNQMFCADTFFMTPEGAILARPASTVRAGEERYIARRLADLGAPVVHTLRGQATFEGADAMWLDPQTVLLARGLRTNDEGDVQVMEALEAMGVAVMVVDLAYGSMHLMGQLRFLDKDLAVAWHGRIAYAAVQAMRSLGINVVFVPDQKEVREGMALNFVTLGPRRILMAAGNPITQKFYESHGVTCVTIEVGELHKAAGGIGCLTGVLERQIMG